MNYHEIMNIIDAFEIWQLTKSLAMSSQNACRLNQMSSNSTSLRTLIRWVEALLISIDDSEHGQLEIVKVALDKENRHPAQSEVASEVPGLALMHKHFLQDIFTWWLVWTWE